jgi:glucosamine-6-phosphate deaminase
MDGNNGLVREFKAGNAIVKIYQDRQSMGTASAKAAGEKATEIITKKGSVSMVFASAPSQEEFLAALAKTGIIKWSNVVAFHLDEYVGLPSEAPPIDKKDTQDESKNTREKFLYCLKFL